MDNNNEMRLSEDVTESDVSKDSVIETDPVAQSDLGNEESKESESEDSEAEETQAKDPGAPFSRKKKILIGVAAFFVVGTILSGIFVVKHEADDRNAKKLNEQLVSMLNDEPTLVASESVEPSPTYEPDPEVTDSQPKEDEPTIDPVETQPLEPAETEIEYLYRFHSLIERYEDFVGWISIGEGISLPVVQAGDNEYYLDHDVEGIENRNGAIFMDYENNPIELGHNTYLYGHHYLGGKEMFAALEKYNNNTYALENSSFYFATLTDEYECQIFSKYLVYPDNWRIYTVNFEDEDDFAAWLEERLELSNCDFGVEVGPDDIILSLSTCDYSFDQARLIIHAVLTKK